MSEQEKLDLILSEVQELKEDMQGMKGDMQGMKGNIACLDKKVSELRLHIENVTDRNVQLLAENHIELVKKLNQAIPVADKNLAYEVKVNYLMDEVEKIKQHIS